MNRVENKVIVLTGANGVLGKVFSEVFLKGGADLALLDINPEVNNFSQELSSKYPDRNIKSYVLDLINEVQVQNTVNSIVKDFGKIDVLINNAASKSKDLKAFFAPYEEYSLSEWRKIMHSNVDSMFLMSREVGKKMVELGAQGSIIQLASIYGICAPDQRIYEGAKYLDTQINTPAVYSASKAAVVGLTKYLSAYWGNQGIRVNTLTPGGIESGQNETFVTNYSKKVPLNRMGRASEIADAAVFLASDNSSYITGQNLVVDGGFTVW